MQLPRSVVVVPLLADAVAGSVPGTIRTRSPCGAECGMPMPMQCVGLLPGVTVCGSAYACRQLHAEVVDGHILQLPIANAVHGILTSQVSDSRQGLDLWTHPARPGQSRV
jgi:hypothetical protein